MYLLGFDIGSSSIKAALVDAKTGALKAQVQFPDAEMSIAAPYPGWAEQDPESWWEFTCKASQKLMELAAVKSEQVMAIGIAYQMHGLVLTDKDGKVLRPSIIWCDSRAVDIGEAACNELGRGRCMLHLLNSPGNFTASKLKWVRDNEPEVFAKIRYVMLPGDYVAMRCTGVSATTVPGLSEGIMWDFQREAPADFLLDYYQAGKELIPEILPSFGRQGSLHEEAAGQLGLRAGIPVTYRAGDQPNNALSLNVMEPGEVAATGGTSGVVYGIADSPVFDPASRVNGFAHVNHTAEKPRIGVLLCINGAGSQYNWTRRTLPSGREGYAVMEARAAGIPAGADGVRIWPFGNGAERMLGNKDIGARIAGLQFNRHSEDHLIRASLEGIAFAFVYGMGIMQEMGLETRQLRVGNDNLFQSRIFSETIATLMDCRIDMLNTSGAAGAARAAGVAVGCWELSQLGQTLQAVQVYEGNDQKPALAAAYGQWKNELEQLLK